MTRLATVVCLTTAIYTFIAATEAVPTHTCNELAPENTEHACPCTPSICSTGQPSLYWLNQDPPSRILQFRNVSRKDDGTHYTCQQNCGGTITEVTYTLHVAYGPSNISIIGNTTFITNGSRTLNLTCQATEVNPSPVYNWTDTHCSKHSHNDTCSFEPHPESDDVINVTCKAVNRITSKAVDIHATINLMYPPATVATISPDSTQTVKAGDTLSCTVTGGKPLVQSVNFSCDIPHPPDQNNTTNNESVTSYITIDTSDAPDDNMTCHCLAYWAPEPSYYTNNVSASFRTEYPAKMKAFTMNGQNGTIIANATTNVTLQCEAHGLPAPNITLQGPHGDDLTGNLTHLNDTHSKMEHTIVAVNDTHMGNYTCISNNNVGKNWETLTFILNVNFPPRFSSSDGPGHSRDTAVNMHEGGIDIKLRTFPVPNNYTFTGYRDNNDLTGKDFFSDPGMFTATASQRGQGSPEVGCHIRPGHNVQKGWLYMVAISNGFGSIQYYFNVTGVPPLPVTSTLPGSKADVGGIVGGVVGGIVAIVVVVVVVIVVWKRKYRRYEKPQPRRDQNSSPYTGLQVMQETDQRLSAHYENSLQNPQGTSPPNCANMAAEPSKTPASTHYVNAQFKKTNISSSAHYVNTEADYDLAQGPDDYVNLETKNNYEQLQPRREKETNVYKTLNTSRRCT